MRVSVIARRALTHALHFLREDCQIHTDREDVTSPVRCAFVYVYIFMCASDTSDILAPNAVVDGATFVRPAHDLRAEQLRQVQRRHTCKSNGG